MARKPSVTADDKAGNPCSKNHLDTSAPYDVVAAALRASEQAILEAFARHFTPNKPVTYADVFGVGIGRRAWALSSGFRLMIEHRNSICALPIVRMQLDTALRLYAGFFATDHQKFCHDVIDGKQIDRLQSDDGKSL